MRMGLIGAVALVAALVLPTLAEAQGQRRPSRADIETMRRFPAGDRLTVRTLNGQAVRGGEPTLFTFSATGRMSGFGGCNPVNADFRHGPNVIRFGPLNFVERRCAPEFSRRERAIFWAIQAARSWRPLPGRGLALSGPRGTLVFGPAF